MNIGIYGGTFDPPHRGHIAAAKAAVSALHLDRLLLIPDAVPPHKALPEGSPTAQQRCDIAVLATAELGRQAEASDMELRRAGVSYTADTLAQLRRQYPEDELYLLMGTDMFLSLQSWRQPERIAALAQGGGEDMLPPAVWGYICRERLYGTHTDLKHLTPDELRPVALSYLKPKRMPHVLGTEQEAVRLAERYGADVTKARVAALLHDCTKKLDMAEQLALCERYRIPLDELERKALKLLHSKTGAAIARDVFAVDDEVYNAILYHTTGKPDMTLLEKIIYLADYIEPTRDFPGVEELRRTVYEDLDRGLLLGLTMTIQEMEELGNPVHHMTRDARDYLMKRGIS